MEKKKRKENQGVNMLAGILDGIIRNRINMEARNA
jgi:hypothetical protein